MMPCSSPTYSAPPAAACISAFEPLSLEYVTEVQVQRMKTILEETKKEKTQGQKEMKKWSEGRKKRRKEKTFV